MRSEGTAGISSRRRQYQGHARELRFEEWGISSLTEKVAGGQSQGGEQSMSRGSE